jgi:hypothetical protein
VHEVHEELRQRHLQHGPPQLLGREKATNQQQAYPPVLLAGVRVIDGVGVGVTLPPTTDDRKVN